jgi:hypothetical protein
MSGKDGGDPSWETVRVPGAELSWTAEGEGPVVVWACGVSSSSFGMDKAGLFDWSPVSPAVGGSSALTLADTVAPPAGLFRRTSCWATSATTS